MMLERDQDFAVGHAGSRAVAEGQAVTAIGQADVVDDEVDVLFRHQAPDLGLDGAEIAFRFLDARARRGAHVQPELAGVRGRYFYGPDVASAEPMALRLVREFLDELDDAARAEAIAALRASLRAHLGPDGVAYRSAMWIITAGRAG